MKYSTEWEILNYPVGTETTNPKVAVGGYDFYVFDIGSGRFVWRTRDLGMEVGRFGSSYYGKVLYHLLEPMFATEKQAMRGCIDINARILSGEIQHQVPVVTPL